MHKVALVNSATHTLKKPRLRERTDRAWFSCLVRYPARKRIGSILTTSEPDSESNVSRFMQQTENLRRCTAQRQENISSSPPRAERQDVPGSRGWRRFLTSSSFTTLQSAEWRCAFLAMVKVVLWSGGGGSPDEARLEQTPYSFQPH